jgi:hypothetical protein
VLSHRIHNPKVGGSIPPPATNKINYLRIPSIDRAEAFSRLLPDLTVVKCEVGTRSLANTQKTQEKLASIPRFARHLVSSPTPCNRKFLRLFDLRQTLGVITPRSKCKRVRRGN